MLPWINDIGDGGPMSSSALTMTADGKTAFFARSDQYGLNRGLSKMTRGGTGSSWSNHRAVDVRDGANQPMLVAEMPWVNADGTRIYFGSSVAGQRIYQAPLAVGGYYGPAKAIAFDADERNPVLSADELRIYVTSYRPHPVDSGAPNQTSFVYTATRPAIDEPFGLPEYVVELNVGFSEMNPAWLSADGCTMLLWGRPPDASRLDLYSASKPPH